VDELPEEEVAEATALVINDTRVGFELGGGWAEVVVEEVVDEEGWGLVRGLEDDMLGQLSGLGSRLVGVEEVVECEPWLVCSDDGRLIDRGKVSCNLSKPQPRLV